MRPAGCFFVRGPGLPASRTVPERRPDTSPESTRVDRTSTGHDLPGTPETARGQGPRPAAPLFPPASLYPYLIRIRAEYRSVYGSVRKSLKDRARGAGGPRMPGGAGSAGLDLSAGGGIG